MDRRDGGTRRGVHSRHRGEIDVRRFGGEYDRTRTAVRNRAGSEVIGVAIALEVGESRQGYGEVVARIARRRVVIGQRDLPGIAETRIRQFVAVLDGATDRNVQLIDVVHTTRPAGEHHGLAQFENGRRRRIRHRNPDVDRIALTFCGRLDDARGRKTGAREFRVVPPTRTVVEVQKPVVVRVPAVQRYPGRRRSIGRRRQKSSHRVDRDVVLLRISTDVRIRTPRPIRAIPRQDIAKSRCPDQWSRQIFLEADSISRVATIGRNVNANVVPLGRVHFEIQRHLRRRRIPYGAAAVDDRKQIDTRDTHVFRRAIERDPRLVPRTGGGASLLACGGR